MGDLGRKVWTEIKAVYWGGQANEKRRPVWTSLDNYTGYKITPAELLRGPGLSTEFHENPLTGRTNPHILLKLSSERAYHVRKATGN